MTASESVGSVRRGKVGRPSKGPRHTFSLRVPVNIARVIARSAQASELTYNDWILRVLEAHLYACGLNLSADETGATEVPSRRASSKLCWPQIGADVREHDS